jgi:uncharacterized repeat protein (TIGR01451 family)
MSFVMHDFSIPRLWASLGAGLMALALALVLSVVPVSAPAAPQASPVTLNLRILKEVRKAASDGTTTITLVPAVKAIPGDRLVYVLTYANTGAQPIGGLVVNYPLPAGVIYRTAAEGSPAPQVSKDGVHFTAFTAGIPAEAITTLRWPVAGNIAPGSRGEISFKATLN